MPYAAGRVIHDADSHIMESHDWLASHADPNVRDRLGRLHLEAAGARADQAINAALERQKDAQATAAVATNVIRGAKGWSAYGAMSSEERKRALSQLKGVEDRVWVQAGEGARIYAIADEDLERENEQKTSAVHFLRFEFDLAARQALAAGAGLAIGVDHPQYQARMTVAPEVRAALVADLS